jgi:hypothetical protein
MNHSSIMSTKVRSQGYQFLEPMLSCNPPGYQYNIVCSVALGRSLHNFTRDQYHLT